MWPSRSGRWSRLALVWLLAGLLLAGLVPPAQAEPPDRQDCLGGPAAVLGCVPTPGRLIGAVARPVGNTVMQSVTGWITEGASWFVDQVSTLVTRSTRPHLDAAWWVGKYRLLLAFSVVVAAATALLAIVDAALKGSWENLLLALGIDVPAAAVAGSAGPILVQYLVDVADWLSGRLLEGFGTTGATALNHTAQWLVTVGAGASGTPTVPLFVGALVALLMIVAGLLVVVELLLRANAIYVITALVPLVYAMRVWPALRPVARRTTEVLVALIFAQPVIALAITLGAAAGASLKGLGDADLADFSIALTGAIMLLLAAMAPWAIMNLLPALEAGMAAHRQRSALTAGPRGAIQMVYTASYLGRLTHPPQVRAMSSGSPAWQAPGAQLGAADRTRPPSGPHERGER